MSSHLRVRTRRSRTRPAVLGVAIAAMFALAVPTASAIDSDDGSTPPPPPLTLAPPAANGSPTPSSSPGAAADPFAEAMAAGRAAVDAEQWPVAIIAFTKATGLQPKSADAFNLLAFSQRKSGRLDDAFKNYRKALAIDPKHRGAHEYLGEAYLQAKNLTAAKKELATLKKLCGTTCEEYQDLAADIAAYERSARSKTKK